MDRGAVSLREASLRSRFTDYARQWRDGEVTVRPWRMRRIDEVLDEYLAHCIPEEPRG